MVSQITFCLFVLFKSSAQGSLKEEDIEELVELLLVAESEVLVVSLKLLLS